MATKVKENDEAEIEREGGSDGPLLDLSDDAVKKMIKAAKKRGYVTMDELNAVLPSEEVTSEQIEDTMSMLSDMGINVVEDDEVDDNSSTSSSSSDDDESESDSESGEMTTSNGTALAAAKKKEPTDRTDDPVRMYLREMGSVELLSREGEIAIAKRIEAGRETMIAGLCESPLTFQAIIIWRDELNEGATLLREIIDLETTYSGPEAKAAPQFQSPEKIEADRKAAEEKEQARRERAANDDVTNVGGEGVAHRGRGRGGGRVQPVARRDGSGIAAAGHGDLRHHRRHLSQAAQAPGSAGRSPAAGDRHPVAGPGTTLQGAQGPAHQGGEEPFAQPEPDQLAGRAALRHQQASRSERGQAPAPRRIARRQSRCRSWSSTRAPSSIRTG